MCNPDSNFFHLQPDEDIDSVVSARNKPSPYITGTGEDILYLTQLFLVHENQLQPFTFTKFSSAVTTLLAYHYIFNIEYPPQIQLVCKFLEKFCLGLSNAKKLTVNSIGIISAIEKQSV